MTNQQKQYSIGIDVGGTKISAVLFNGEKVIADDRLATPKDTLDHFMVMLNALIEPLLEKAKKDKVKVKGIGIAIPGPINYKEGKVITCTNLHLLDGVKLAQLMEEKIRLPIKLDHDIMCMLRAEMKLGVGQKYKNVYGVTISTGIGGAWWINNKVYKGAQNGAGEINFMIIDFEKGINLEEAYHKLTQANPAKLATEAYRGDILAEKAFAEVGRDLGIAFANIVNIIDPEAIIVFGGTIQSSDLFLPIVKKTMREYINSPESKKVKVLKSKLGKHAGAIGAALLIT